MIAVRAARLVAALTATWLLIGACEAGPPPATPPISPGSVSAPREVNIIAKDWQFLPDPVDFVPGETVLLHLVNGGLEIHEVVIGDAAIQDAWEVAEAAAAGHPPGPTPVVSVPPEMAGLRVVVPSGQRIDVTWTVPADVASAPAPRLVADRLPHPRPLGERDGRGHSDRAAVTRPVSVPVVRFESAPGSGPAGSRRRDEMTYVIAEPCIDVLDISCVSVCPVDCIHYEEGVDRKLFIDPNECIDCGACEPECPVNAIFPEESLPTEWAQYTAIDATWYTDKAAARAATDAEKPR